VEGAGRTQAWIESRNHYLDINTLVSFFYEIANYNLVLYSVDEEFDMPITDDPTLVRTDAQIVALGLWEDVLITILPDPTI
jgi:hypothetical protein